ncbi:MAG: FecCD family ABC transporter permease [Myxococcaceae bacterium]
MRADAVRFTPVRALLSLALLSALLAVALLLALAFGEKPLSLATALNDAASIQAEILWSVRLPRALLAALVGAALASTGATLQALTRNPLADSFVLGVSGGAALGATVALALGSVGALPEFLRFFAGELSGQSLFAFAGALAATALVLAMGRLSGSTRSESLVLAGVIFNAFALAAVTFIKTLSAPDKLGEILYWLAGSLGYEQPRTLLTLAIVEGMAVGGLWLLSSRLNLLSQGDEEAAALGVDVARTRLWLLLLASLAVAAAVALAGLVGFVGLIVPHLLRLWLGPDQRLLVPASALGGAAFLVLADLLARSLYESFEAVPPVGVVTAFIGGPCFFWLLWVRHREPR